MPHPNRWLFLGILLALQAGCASYQFGARSMYAGDVQTVYVPIIESNSFRRQLGERLTEAVIKEIELKTNYKVVAGPHADSILTGRIVEDDKKVLVENINDDPRALELNLVVEVTWLNARGDLIAGPGVIPLSPEVVNIGQSATLIAEVGQSIATAQQEAISRLAEQIVATMEAPW